MTKQPDMMELDQNKPLDIGAAAAYLRISTSQLYQLTSKRLIGHSKPGGKKIHIAAPLCRASQMRNSGHKNRRKGEFMRQQMCAYGNCEETDTPWVLTISYKRIVNDRLRYCSAEHLAEGLRRQVKIIWPPAADRAQEKSRVNG